MGFFKQSSQDDILKLLDGHEDVLTPRTKQELEFVSSQICPRCGGNVVPEHYLPRMLNGGPPRPLARCGECHCLFDPYSGLLLEMGNLGRLEPAVPIIHPSDD